MKNKSVIAIMVGLAITASVSFGMTNTDSQMIALQKKQIALLSQINANSFIQIDLQARILSSERMQTMAIIRSLPQEERKIVMDIVHEMNQETYKQLGETTGERKK